MIDVADKPLTIIYPQGKNLAANLLSADGTIGIRITQEIFQSDYAKCFESPLFRHPLMWSGNPSPGNFAEISDEIKQKMDYIVDFRQGEEQNKVVRLALLSCKRWKFCNFAIINYFPEVQKIN